MALTPAPVPDEVASFDSLRATDPVAAASDGFALLRLAVRVPVVRQLLGATRKRRKPSIHSTLPDAAGDISGLGDTHGALHVWNALEHKVQLAIDCGEGAILIERELEPFSVSTLRLPALSAHMTATAILDDGRAKVVDNIAVTSGSARVFLPRHLHA
eukprot:m.252791 g.252791  ORF g.252791 m.252791 type:complete len:158 (+) comp17972_c0_seq1:55-528(+)